MFIWERKTATGLVVVSLRTVRILGPEVVQLLSRTGLHDLESPLELIFILFVFNFKAEYGLKKFAFADR